MQQIEFLYDFGSPDAYLVHRVLPALAARHGARLRHLPILLEGAFRATGDDPREAHAGTRGRLAYRMRETERFVRRHGIRYHMNPHHPLDTLAVMRGAIHARGRPWEGGYVDTVFNAIWIHGQKMDEAEVIADALREAGLPAAEIMAAIAAPATRQALADATAAAVARGVFGVPTMFVGDEMFFGRHSLPDLEYHLSQGG